MEDTDKKYKEVLIELQNMADRISHKYDESREKEELRERSYLLGRLCVLGYMIEQWYYELKAAYHDEQPTLSEWKLNLKMESSLIGRIYRLRKQLYETVKQQSKNIESELIESMTDRKHSNNG